MILLLIFFVIWLAFGITGFFILVKLEKNGSLIGFEPDAIDTVIYILLGLITLLIAFMNMED